MKFIFLLSTHTQKLLMRLYFSLHNYVLHYYVLTHLLLLFTLFLEERGLQKLVMRFFYGSSVLSKMQMICIV